MLARKLMAVTLALALLSTVMPCHAIEASVADSVSVSPQSANPGSYAAYLAAANTDAAAGEYSVAADKSLQRVKCTLSEYKGKSGVLMLDPGGEASFPISVRTPGLYHIQLTYVPLPEESIGQNKISLALNGKVGFDSMQHITLSQEWQNNGEIATDSRGNQILPGQELSGEWITRPILDPEGRYNQPLRFYFNQGENIIRLTSRIGRLALAGICVFAGEPLPEYAKIRRSYNAQNAPSDASNLLEAENYASKSDTTILPDFDKSDAATQPSDPVRLVFNYIPGNRFSSSGQWIKWKLTVPKSGLYNITLRVRQNIKSGFSSSRRLMIDGQVPFREADILTFESSGSWYQKTLGNGHEDYLFFFEQGREYTLSLEAVPGPLSDVTLALDDAVYRLNSLYRGVVMVAGTNPDKYRDYNLKTEIPGVIDSIKDLSALLKKQESTILKVNRGRSGSELTIIRSLLNRLKRIEKDPDELARTLGSFKADIEALSTWNMDAKNQPLDIDYIAVHSPEGELPRERAGFFDGLFFSIKRLLASYMKDYGTVGEIYDEKTAVNVWLTLGRDQLDAFKKLVDNEFTREYGIRVNASLVPTGIREAVLAGKAPDAALFLSSDEPFNLASRGALENLTPMAGFDEVRMRFSQDALNSFFYKDGCYALPITETFPMMFARTDILHELGLSPPNTWDEMLETAAVLQRKNMEIGIPASLGMFATLLFQNGGSFYAEDQSRTGFDSQAAIDAFTLWTGLFSQYGFPIAYDFYNRFRSGEMPLGIAPYSIYTMFEVAAPEIAGRWQMIPLPGVLKNGKIDRSVSISNADGTGINPGLNQGLTSAVIFSKSSKKEDAWQLLDWFTSDQAQAMFGMSVEALLGPIARYTPANINAFKRLPWEDVQSVLLEQWERVVVIPEIPGGYYIARGINNAFRRVIYQYENSVDTLNRYNLQVNKEIARKWREANR